MTVLKFPTVYVAGRPDRAIGQFCVLDVPTTHVLWSPMQGGQSITLSSLSVATLHALPFFADTSGSWQSEDVSAPVIQLVPEIERLRLHSRLLGHVETPARDLAVGTMHHSTRLHH